MKNRTAVTSLKTFRTAYGPRHRVQTDVGGPSLTKQSFKEECDINVILRRFEKTGQLPDLIKQNPTYGDFSDVASYHEALNIVHLASEQFDNLSSRVRERFGNDPAKFLEFANDPKNSEEMVKLGLAVERTNQTNEGNATPEKPLPVNDQKVEKTVPNPKT